MFISRALVACIIFGMQSICALGPIPTLSIYIHNEEDSDTTNDVIATLWFNHTIYEYTLPSTQIGSVQTSTANELTIIDEDECTHRNKISETKVMLENDHLTKAVVIDKVELITASGTWYGIDATCVFQEELALYTGAYEKWLIDVASCSTGKADNFICVDNDPNDCGPYKQMYYFDTARPNEYILDANYMDATDVIAQFESCDIDPTISPTEYPSVSPITSTVAPSDDPSAFPTTTTRSTSALPTYHPSMITIILSAICVITFCGICIAIIGIIYYKRREREADLGQMKTANESADRATTIRPQTFETNNALNELPAKSHDIIEKKVVRDAKVERVEISQSISSSSDEDLWDQCDHNTNVNTKGADVLEDGNLNNTEKGEMNVTAGAMIHDKIVKGIMTTVE